MQNTASRVQIYFIEKYAVAQSPKRDYYGLRVSNNQLTLITWKIARGPHRFPLERKISLQDIVTNNNFQDEIFRLFGEETLRQVLQVVSGQKDYLQRLPPVLLRHILINLDSKDIISFSETSELCREAVKNTIPFLDMHQKSFNNIKIKKQFLGQRKPYKDACSRISINDGITKSNTNCSKVVEKKRVLDSSLSRPSTAKILNHIVPLKKNASTNSMVVNSSNPESTLSVYGNISCIPKFESLISGLLPINRIRTNSKAVLKTGCSKQNSKYSVVIEKNKESETFNAGNKAEIKMDSRSKMFEVSSIIPEHFVDKKRSEGYISKPLSYRCVESSEAKSERNFKSYAASLESNKKSINKMLSKGTEKKIQNSGLGDGDKRKNIGSSKKSKDLGTSKSSKLKAREESVIHTTCKTRSKK